MGVRAPSLKAIGDDFAWSLLDSVPDATLVVAATGEIVFVNDHAGALFGREVDDLLGRSIEDLLPVGLRAIHRAHRTRYRAEPVNRAMGEGLDLRALRSDGTELPVEISLSPLVLGGEVHVIAAVRDISARVEAEERMHRVVRTLDASNDGVFIFDAETLQYSFVNEGACRLVGYERDELLAMTPLHLNPYGTEAEYRRLVDELLDEDRALLRRSTLLRRDGVEVPVEKTLRSAPRGRDGSAWVIAFSRDISARLAAEAELEANRRSLDEAERAIAVSADRERIARDLHDTVIQRLFAEGLSLQGVLSTADDATRVRAKVGATIDALDDTIKDLRTAIFSLQSRHESGPGGVRGRLLEIVTAASPGLGFDARLQFDGAIEVLDDRVVAHLEQVLREALSNVTRHAHARSVRVAMAAEAGFASLTVIDDGVGVPDEVIGGHGTTNMAERASALGGELCVRRGERGGTVLRWRVPVARD